MSVVNFIYCEDDLKERLFDTFIDFAEGYLQSKEFSSDPSITEVDLNNEMNLESGNDCGRKSTVGRVKFF